MDVLREIFGYPFMELAHPAGGTRLVTKVGPKTGASYGIGLAGILWLWEVLEDRGNEKRIKTVC